MVWPAVIAAGASIIGSKIAANQRERAAGRALNAVQPYNVSGIFGSANFDDGELELGLSPELRQAYGGAVGLGRSRLRDLGNIDFQARESRELDRLRTLRAPEIAQARSGLQSKLLARGRIGLATGGGVSGGLFNPETAALEEAIMRTQLGDIGAARQFSQQEQNFLQGSAQNAFGLAGSIGSLPNQYAGFGINAGRNADPVAGLQAAPGFASADAYSGFFSALGNQLPGIFGGAGKHPGPPPGARPNGLGGLFL